MIKEDELNQSWHKMLEKAREGYNGIYYGVIRAEGRQEKHDAQKKLKAAIEVYHFNLPLQTEFLDTIDLPDDQLEIYRRDYPQDFIHFFDRGSDETLLNIAKSVCRTLLKIYPQPLQAVHELHEDEDAFQVILKVPKNYYQR